MFNDDINDGDDCRKRIETAENEVYKDDLKFKELTLVQIMKQVDCSILENGLKANEIKYFYYS